MLINLHFHVQKCADNLSFNREIKLNFLFIPKFICSINLEKLIWNISQDLVWHISEGEINEVDLQKLWRKEW